LQKAKRFQASGWSSGLSVMANFMNTETEIALREIGRQLDSFSFPVVKNGGIVVPGKPAASPWTTGTELENVKSGKTRSETGSRARAPARHKAPDGSRSSSGSRPSFGSGAPGQAAPLVSAELPKQYVDELAAVERAYPGMQCWRDDKGMWLLVESSLLPGVSPKANFLVAIPFGGPTLQGSFRITIPTVRAWGFWGSPATGYEWIGPRHTNFPDGSICAFEPKDGTWMLGAPLVDLLDLYTLWAVRHLHLRVFGRWPGYQAVPHPYERVLELREDEHCGCGNSHKLYGHCCRNDDFARNQIVEALRFTLHMAGGLRKPPSTLVKFLLERLRPPSIEDAFTPAIER